MSTVGRPDFERPLASCGCGFDLVWVNGAWEHDAAPSLWGGDHEPDAPAPTSKAREEWDLFDLGPPAESTPVLKVPPFQMDVQGTYQGDAYPTQAEYRIHAIEETGTDNCLLSVEDVSGNEVGTLTITPELADGIIGMSQIDHGLGGYEDDWKIPAGMGRVLDWTLQTDLAHHIVLGESAIDEIAAWLRFATGEEEWTGGDEWEY